MLCHWQHVSRCNPGITTTYYIPSCYLYLFVTFPGCPCRMNQPKGTNMNWTDYPLVRGGNGKSAIYHYISISLKNTDIIPYKLSFKAGKILYNMWGFSSAPSLTGEKSWWSPAAWRRFSSSAASFKISGILRTGTPKPRRPRENSYYIYT